MLVLRVPTSRKNHCVFDRYAFFGNRISTIEAHQHQIKQHSSPFKKKPLIDNRCSFVHHGTSLVLASVTFSKKIDIGVSPHTSNLEAGTMSKRLSKCPDCSGVISKSASKCPHCGRVLLSFSLERFLFLFVLVFVGLIVIAYISKQ